MVYGTEDNDAEGGQYETFGKNARKYVCLAMYCMKHPFATMLWGHSFSSVSNVYSSLIGELFAKIA
jgi:hypothetical protein